jgi:hypothetical protein
MSNTFQTNKFISQYYYILHYNPMEKPDYYFDYILTSCKNDRRIYLHVIVRDKDAFLKQQEWKIKTRKLNQSTRLFSDIITKNATSSIIISRCIICNKGFLFDQNLIKKGESVSLKCQSCIFENI